jgi:drug/metabolite transporter (DMT)-like permease
MIDLNIPLRGNELLALAAAVLWGGGDFAGGMGVKSAGGGVRAALRVVLLSHAASFMALVLIARLRGDMFPHGALLAWGIAAGMASGLSLTCFYVALSRGTMGASAAVSGLLAATIPAVVAMWQAGSPGMRPMAGFGLAGLAIWLIAAASVRRGERAASSETMLLAGLAGVGFGFYFVALKMAGAGGVVWPMATARIGSLTTCSLLVLWFGMKRERPGDVPVRFGRRAAGWALGTAMLDTSGNLLFLAATRAGRLDIAAVLASLYPASTILLAAVALGQRPTRRQAVGMVTAVLAVILIAM